MRQRGGETGGETERRRDREEENQRGETDRREVIRAHLIFVFTPVLAGFVLVYFSIHILIIDLI